MQKLPKNLSSTMGASRVEKKMVKFDEYIKEKTLAFAASSHHLTNLIKKSTSLHAVTMKFSC